MYQVYLPEHFLRQLKSYRKKYRHFEEDLIQTLENFQPELSDRLGNKLYKVRMKSRDLPRGKSKSFRIIIFLVEVKKLIVPLTCYFKGDRQDISGKEIEYHLQIVLNEIQNNKIEVLPAGRQALRKISVKKSQWFNKIHHKPGFLHPRRKFGGGFFVDVNSCMLYLSDIKRSLHL